MFTVPVLLLALVSAQDKPKPKLPLGKDTTFVTEPLDKEGYVDYEAALNDRLAKGIAPEKNAVVLLWKALGPKPEGGTMPAEFFKRLGLAEPPEQGDYFVGLQRYMSDQLKLERDEWDTHFDYQSRATQRVWAAGDYPLIADWLKLNEKPLAVAVEATRRPDYYNPLVSRQGKEGHGSLIGVLLPGVQKCRELATALAARALLRAQAGKFEEAWQDLLACHRLGRLVARGGTLIELLVGIATEQVASQASLAYLERAGLTAKQVQDHLKDLGGLPPFPPLADKLAVSERFMYLDSLQLVIRGGVGTLEGLSGGKARKPTPEELKAMEKIDWGPALRDGNRWYDRMGAALRQPDRAERVKAFGQIETDLKALKTDALDRAQLLKKVIEGGDPGKEVGQAINNIMISLLTPALNKVQDAADRIEQIQRNQRLAFALAAYRADHGRYPAKLDDLAPKYLAAVPNDLFAAKPLTYRVTARGYLLYSVGVNGQDDDGRWIDDDPRGDDPRVLMPLPALKPKQ